MEMLVYIGILVLMLGVIMNITVSIVRSHRAIKASRSIENSAIVSLERISREVRGTNTVNIASSILDTNPGKLVLNGTDDVGNPRTVEFYLASGTLFLKENGVDVGPLSQSDAQVNNLTFHLFSNVEFVGVRVEMAIESGTSTYYRSGNFYSSANIR